MTEQEKLIDRMGKTLWSIHVDKNDPNKDEQYWRDFAVSCERARATQLGLLGDFEEALAGGRLANIQNTMTLQELRSEHEMARRVYFLGGLVVGFVLAHLLPSLMA